MLANVGLCGEKCNAFSITNTLRWMLKIKAEYNVSLSTVYGQLNLASLESKLKLNHLRWYEHEERSEK